MLDMLQWAQEAFFSKTEITGRIQNPETITCSSAAFSTSELALTEDEYLQTLPSPASQIPPAFKMAV